MGVIDGDDQIKRKASRFGLFVTKIVCGFPFEQTNSSQGDQLIEHAFKLYGSCVTLWLIFYFVLKFTLIVAQHVKFFTNTKPGGKVKNEKKSQKRTHL